VERALGLLAEVCSAQALSLADCARRADLSPSTALRLLRTLESAEFVARDTRGYFHAGPRLIQLGAAALGRESLVRMAEPSLHRMVAISGESAYISVLGPGDTALYVGMVEGTYAVRHASRIGRTVPLEGTAVGEALRGEVPDAGYVVRASAVEDGVAAIAAPIRRPAGIAGALSLVGPAYRIDDERSRAFGALVAREARAIAARYGVDPEWAAEAAETADTAGAADAADLGAAVSALSSLSALSTPSTPSDLGTANAENTGNEDDPGNPADVEVARG
jgi:urocanate hydratase